MNDIERALDVAGCQHRGQVDKAGVPYILHVLQVAAALDPSDPELIIAALLHDVVEDTPMYLTVLRAQFGNSIADIVDHLTRRRGESYPEFIQRVKKHPKARKIKIADIQSNLRPDRLALLPPEERDRLRDKYVPHLWELQSP